MADVNTNTATQTQEQGNGTQTNTTANANTTGAGADNTPKVKTEEEIRAEIQKEYEKMADKRVTDALKKRDKEWADKQAKEKMTEDERRQAEEQERLQAQAKRDLDLTINPFGGNKQDYVEKTDALDGVGGTVVIPVWNGGGTVKLIIINSDFGVASSTLVKAVQEAIDPDPQGTGSGIAPIGHTVTVVSAVGKTVSIKSRITLNDGYQWSQVKPKAEETLEAYFLEMRKNWEKGNLVVRISQIENRLLNLDGILDVADTQLNDVASNLALAQEEIPLLGGVYIG